ncbi:nicotinate-nucleotide--dimethylbenzimidazole phosphoribosyltransferase [Streptomyces sp. NPDC005970]|uniref:nicotinate-nucleotide--dimethylbenzimidazole phosphoribosyltransferase n=1 Tax=Streptomyces sp. NPDC005970 TaxID=3156723 RepID=UPI00340DEBE6
MTDTGQVPGEGLPENAGGRLGQPHPADVPIPPADAGFIEQPQSAYTFLNPHDAVGEEDDLLLMPGAQGAWSEHQPQYQDPYQQPMTHLPGAPGPYETAGYAPAPAEDYDAGLVYDQVPVAAYDQVPGGGYDAGPAQDYDQAPAEYEDVLPEPQPAPVHQAHAQAAPSPRPLAHAAPTTPRRPLHMGPPVPDPSNGIVRSLADRGPAGTPTQSVPVHQAEPPAAGPQYIEGPHDDAAPLPGAPWDAQPPQAAAPTTEAAAPAEELEELDPFDPRQYAKPAAPEAAEFQGMDPAVDIPAQVHPDAVPDQQDPVHAPGADTALDDAAEAFAGPMAGTPAQSHPQAEQSGPAIAIPAQADGTALPAEPAPQPVPVDPGHAIVAEAPSPEDPAQGQPEQPQEASAAPAPDEAAAAQPPQGRAARRRAARGRAATQDEAPAEPTAAPTDAPRAPAAQAPQAPQGRRRRAARGQGQQGQQTQAQETPPEAPAPPLADAPVAAAPEVPGAAPVAVEAVAAPTEGAPAAPVGDPSNGSAATDAPTAPAADPAGAEPAAPPSTGDVAEAQAAATAAAVADAPVAEGETAGPEADTSGAAPAASADDTTAGDSAAAEGTVAATPTSAEGEAPTDAPTADAPTADVAAAADVPASADAAPTAQQPEAVAVPGAEAQDNDGVPAAPSAAEPAAEPVGQDATAAPSADEPAAAAAAPAGDAAEGAVVDAPVGDGAAAAPDAGPAAEPSAVASAVAAAAPPGDAAEDAVVDAPVGDVTNAALPADEPAADAPGGDAEGEGAVADAPVENGATAAPSADEPAAAAAAPAGDAAEGAIVDAPVGDGAAAAPGGDAEDAAVAAPVGDDANGAPTAAVPVAAVAAPGGDDAASPAADEAAAASEGTEPDAGHAAEATTDDASSAAAEPQEPEAGSQEAAPAAQAVADASVETSAADETPEAEAAAGAVPQEDASATAPAPAEAAQAAAVEGGTDNAPAAPAAAAETSADEAPAEAPAPEPAAAAGPETTAAEATAPETTDAETTDPEPAHPQAVAPEAVAPDPETTSPETASPDAPTVPPAEGYAEAERAAVHRVIRDRRDIRNGFRSDPIPHEVLLRVLEAAHTAPSVGHSQPWDFVVIRSEETRRTMHELAMRQRDAYAKSLPKGRAKQFKQLKVEAILETPVNIVVTADPTRGGRHTLGRHTQPQMAPYSSALAVENLWLAARAEGLGVGWVSFFDEREMVRALGLPEHLEIVAYLCVGYVDEFPDEPELMKTGWSKRRPLSWVVHEETYGRRALPGEDPANLLQETLRGIRPLDAKALGEAWERQKRMTKPSGALGMLEIISAQLSGLSRKCPPPIPEPATVAIFAGDHGVHAQGVTAWPQEVTGQMVANFLGGGAVCNAFASQVGAEVCVVDVGVAGELPSTPGLLPRKVRAGTGDFTVGPALTREEALRAIEVGIETARDLVAAGNKVLLTGEMGIANTTVSAALISVYTGVDAAEVTGRGTGINDEMHARKVDVVRRGLELHQPDPADPIGVLTAFGGLEHAAMAGLLLGGASLRTPVILDGVSAGAAALIARAIAPEVLAACIAGHRSAEPGHVAALNKLGLRPLVDLDLRLGEGTGALLALPVVQSAARAMHEVATFDSAGVTEKG